MAACGGGDMPTSCLASLHRHPNVLGYLRASRSAQAERSCSHVSSIRQASAVLDRPPHNSIPLRSYLDHLDKQLSRSPIADLDAYDSHGMMAVSRRGRHSVQDESPSQPQVAAKSCCCHW